jgi:hypothetical protein
MNKKALLLNLRNQRRTGYNADRQAALRASKIQLGSSSSQEVSRAGIQKRQARRPLRPRLCIHAGECVRGLASVFNVSKKPWIDVMALSPRRLIDQDRKEGTMGVILEHPCRSGRFGWVFWVEPMPHGFRQLAG